MRHMSNTGYNHILVIMELISSGAHKKQAGMGSWSHIHTCNEMSVMLTSSFKGGKQIKVSC